ncbi:MAG: hypothetical protein KA953_05960 [Lachnospiraceae bacterium]|nr:hypothetical protein [Lachnospiraceae bacterium]
MEDLREQQKEALLTARDYIGKLLDAVDVVGVELSGEEQEDTKEYLDTILKGVNWTIEVLKRTIDYVNENEELIQKESVNDRMLHFSSVYESSNRQALNEALQSDVKTYLSEFMFAIDTRNSYTS